jgi:hypothetical protein
MTKKSIEKIFEFIGSIPFYPLISDLFLDDVDGFINNDFLALCLKITRR